MGRRHFPLAAVLSLVVLGAACGRSKAVTAGTHPSPKGTRAPAPAKMGTIPSNGLEVIGWMRRAHPSRELRSLAFTINTTEYRGASEKAVVSRGYAALPGRLRVDVLPEATRSGFVRNRQRLSVFDRGRRVSTLRRVDLATMMVYDLFAQNIDTTIMWLDSAKVRIALLRRAELDDRRVWVVGAAEGDTASPQFWVDADKWRVVRVIQRDARNRVTDVRFTEYTEVLDVPIPTRIVTYRGGELVQEQELSAFMANPSLPTSAFDLARWRRLSLGN
jgi:outer membrane lipoprotein-sorting protein